MKLKSVSPKIEGTYLKPVPNCGHGGYGMAIQHSYDYAGIPTNYGPGNDLPKLNREIKSWEKTRKGHITVGASTIDDIIADDGAVFLEKLQYWNLHIHERGVPKTVRKVDFTGIHDILIQELAELSDQLLAGTVTPKSEHLILEHIKGDSWKLRIKFNKAENLFGMAASSKQFDGLFFEDAA